jgi:hypothetical protein
MDLHQYADMSVLKEGLDPQSFDQVRAVLGLQPLSEAAAAGSRITERVRASLS